MRSGASVPGRVKPHTKVIREPTVNINPRLASEMELFVNQMMDKYYGKLLVEMTRIIESKFCTYLKAYIIMIIKQVCPCNPDSDDYSRILSSTDVISSNPSIDEVTYAVNLMWNKLATKVDLPTIPINMSSTIDKNNYMTNEMYDKLLKNYNRTSHRSNDELTKLVVSLFRDLGGTVR